MSDKIISLYRARLAREKGTVRKDWGGRISIALVYPNYYRLAMSNLGFQVVYHLLNARDHCVAERVFLPEDQEKAFYNETGKGLLSLESQSPVHKFDLVAFSISFENDYPNVLEILDLGKIPILSKERDESYPLILAGGITTFMNPEPLADFFDLFLLGEAEAALDEFITGFTEIHGTMLSKREGLKILAKNIRSIYIPSFYHVSYHNDGTIKSMEPTEDQVPESIEVSRQPSSNFPVNISNIITPETEFADKLLIECGRGCGRSCRFCAAGYVYRPPRVHTESELLASLKKIMEEVKNLGLLSPMISDTPGIENVTDFIIRNGGNFSVSSLRADSITRELLDHLGRGGQKTIAIAPEAGSERLRKVINKHLTMDQIMRTVGLISRTGEFNLRLYFLIGLPTETREDVSEMLELIKSIKHQIIKESRSRGRIGRIKSSVNCFIPKPFTPFQWFPLEDVSVLKERQKWLKKAMAKEGGLKVSFDVPKWAYVQTLLSMGDRRVGSMLMLSHKNKGDWSRAFRFSEINPDFFVHRPRSLDEILPWDFIDHGLHKEYLIKEHTLALKGQESDVCHVGACDKCGVCKN